MSTLSSQLTYLQSTLKTTTTTQGKKEKPLSFLWTSDQAYRISNQQLLGMARNGFEKMIAIDQRFREVESLFAEGSLEVERDLLTSDMNEQVERKIRRFLRLSSKYFLLETVHLCLEYLVRQFQIHVYDVDEVMGCIIPYHETVVFTSMVKILNLNETWKFLESIQKKKVVLPRSTLLLACRKNYSVLEFIATCCLEYLSEELDHRAYISFFALISMEYLDTLDGSSDIILKRLLPHIFSGLKSGHYDMQAASLMILTKALSKLDLQENALTICMNEVCQNYPQTHSIDVDKFLSFVYQSQTLDRIPSDIVEFIWNRNDFFTNMQRLGEKYDISAFCRALLLSALEDSFEEGDIEILQIFMQDLSACHNQIQFLVVKILESFQDKGKERICHELIKYLKLRYPDEFDQGLKLCSQNFEQNVVSNFVSFSFTFDPRLKHELIEKLQHPSPLVRIQAFDELEGIDSLDPVFFSDLLFLGLKDEDDGVVKRVLSFKNLSYAVEVGPLVAALTNLAKRTNLKSALLHLLSKLTAHDEVIPLILILMQYPHFHKELFATVHTFNHPLFGSLNKFTPEEADFSSKVLQQMARNVKNHPDTRQVLYGSVLNSLNPVAILIHAFSIEQNSFEEILSVYESIQPRLRELRHSSELSLTMSSDDAIVFYMEQLASRINDFDLPYLHGVHQNLKSDIFYNMALNHNPTVVYQVSIEKLFVNLGTNVLQFLASFWLDQSIPTRIQSFCLHLASQCIKAAEHLDFHLLIPTLFTPMLHNTSIEIRRAAVEIIQDICGKKDGKLFQLFDMKPLSPTLIDSIGKVINQCSARILATPYPEVYSHLPKKHQLKVAKFIASSVEQLKNFPDGQYSVVQCLFSLFPMDPNLLMSMMDSVLKEYAAMDNFSDQQSNILTILLQMLTFVTEIDQYVFIILKLIGNTHASENGFIPSVAMPEILTSVYSRISKECQLQILKACVQIYENKEINAAYMKFFTSTTFASDIVLQLIQGDVDESLLEILILIKAEDKTKLLLPLCHHLSQCLVSENHYRSTMVLSSMLSIVKEEKMNPDDESIHVFVDTVVQCLNKSQDSQVIRHAILLIAELSSTYPTLIIQHVRILSEAIQNSLKQQNDYNLEIMKTVSFQLLPQLNEYGVNVISLVKIFVNCVDHIPQDSIQSFYTGLVKSVSRDKLSVVALLFFQLAIERQSNRYLGIASEIILFFGIPRQLDCLIHLLQYVDSALNDEDFGDFEWDHTLGFTALEYVADHLQDNKFIKAFNAYERDGNSKRISQTKIVELGKNLILIAESGQTDRIRKLIQIIYPLISPKAFCKIFKISLEHDSIEVQITALELMNYFLSEQIPKIVEYTHEEPKYFLKLQQQFLQNLDSKELKIQQLSLISLDLLTRRFKSISPERVIQPISRIMDKLNIATSHHIFGSGCLCMATLLSVDHPSVISHIPKFTKRLTQLFLATLDGDAHPKTQELMIKAYLFSLNQVVKYHVKFLGPYIQDIIQIVLDFKILSSTNKKIHSKGHEILQSIVECDYPRIIIGPLFKSFGYARDFGVEAMESYFGALTTFFSGWNEKFATKKLADTLKFFLDVLNSRTIASFPSIDEVEDYMIEAFISFILKLDTQSMQPLLVTLSQWKNDNEEARVSRTATFYHLIGGLSEQLGKFFSPYWKILFSELCADMNETVCGRKRKRNAESDWSNEIIIYSVKTMQMLCQKHNQDILENSDEFEEIATCLTQQISNVKTSSTEYSHRIEEFVRPCCVLLAQSAPDHDLWKILQLKILEVADEASSIKVKIECIKTLDALYSELDGFVMQVAQTFPFLTELLEVDNENLNLQLVDFVKKLEQLTGENIRDHLLLN